MKIYTPTILWNALNLRRFAHLICPLWDSGAEKSISDPNVVIHDRILLHDFYNITRPSRFVLFCVKAPAGAPLHAWRHLKQSQVVHPMLLESAVKIICYCCYKSEDNTMLILFSPRCPSVIYPAALCWFSAKVTFVYVMHTLRCTHAIRPVPLPLELYHYHFLETWKELVQKCFVQERYTASISCNTWTG